MKPALILPFLIFISYINLNAQTNVDLTDNLIVNTGDHLIINPGDYSFLDTEGDGIMQIKNVQDVIIDAENVTLTGGNFSGYGIKIEGCTNVTLKNFKNISNYYYAVHIINSTGITIENSTINSNKRDDEGWITIFDGAAQALGGAVFMDDCHDSHLHHNSMTDQNDGIALYNCTNITVDNNYLSWNTAFGIRMFHTHDCTITNNEAAHINRDTDPSDCASILLLDSFNNTVTDNNFEYSGDGIFLNNYNSNSFTGNYFARNKCSYSPHNAIEAVFSHGNVFVHNECNYSNYGFWLGYSTDCVVDSNIIRYNSGLDANGGGGIAIDRGWDNRIRHNLLTNNSIAIQLWEGNGIPPYEDSPSALYQILHNTFVGNKIGVSVSNTSEIRIENSTMLWNGTDLKIQGNTVNARIQDNTFSGTIGTIIENSSTQPLYLANNTFDDYSPLGSDVFDCKFLNVSDLGTHTLESKTYQQNKSGDLTEPDGENNWFDFYCIEDAAATVLSWDTNEKHEGTASLFCDTESGWDVVLHYLPMDSSRQVLFDLDPDGDITFAAKINITDPNNPWGVQESFVRIGDVCGNYLQYTNEYFTTNNNPAMNASLDTWATYSIPLSGNDQWTLTSNGNLDLTKVTYVEFSVDVWEYGYELWLDAVRLPLKTTGTQAPSTSTIHIYPNPVHDLLNVKDENLSGLSYTIVDENGISLTGGTLTNDLTIDVSRLPDGVYLLKFSDKQKVRTQKFVVGK